MLDWFAISGFVVSNFIAGVIGNRADVIFCQCWQRIYERLRQGGQPVNHDLQRAIRKAILQATLCLISDALARKGVNVQNLIRRFWFLIAPPRDEESRWLLRTYNELAHELEEVPQAEYVPPLFRSRKPIGAFASTARD